MNDLYVLEYDLDKNGWHIESVKNMLTINQEVYLSGRHVAFIPVAIATTREEINQIKAQMIALQQV